VLLKFFLFALLLLLGVQGGYAEASKGGRQRGQGHAKQPRHAMQSPALFTTSFCVLVAFFPRVANCNQVATVSTVSTASSVSAKILHAWLGTEKKAREFRLELF